MPLKRDRPFLSVMRRLAKDGDPTANAILRQYLGARSRVAQLVAISSGSQLMLASEYKRLGYPHGATVDGLEEWISEREEAANAAK